MKITLLTGKIFNLSDIFGFEIKTIKTPLAKRLTLRIDEKNRIPVLTIPENCSKKKAISFINSHLDWIKQTLSKLPPAQKFTTNQQISFMGKKITIIHSPERRDAFLDNDTLLVGGNIEFLHRRTADYIKKHAQLCLYDLSKHYAEKLNCKIKNVTLKDTKSRWGSCSNKNNINYNWRIAMAPYFVIEYLVCHEVSHLAHQNHSPAFWECVANLCPQYKEARNWLKEQGKTLYRFI